MTFEKYKELKEKFYKKEIEKYKNTLKLFKDKEPDYTKYDVHYTRNNSKILEDRLYGLELQELKTIIDRTLEELNDDDNIQVYNNTLDMATSINRDGCVEIDDMYIEIYYTEMLPESEVNNKIDSLWRHEVSKLIKPDVAKSIRRINLTLFELFEAGKIDWETLQECVYKDVK